MMRHFAEMERTSAAVFHVEHDLLPSVREAQRENPKVTALVGLDWSIIRPDANAPTSGAEQLADVVAAAGRLAVAHLLRLLVPALARRAIPEPVDLGNLIRLQECGDGDPFEHRLLDLLVRQILDKRVYGFDGVALEWAARPFPGDGGVAWLPAGRPVAGRCQWHAGLNGFGWEGEAEVEAEAALALAPLPSVLIDGGEALPLAAWSCARFPSLCVAAGPLRTVRLGGDSVGGALRLWVEDGGPRREHRLDCTAPTGDAVTVGKAPISEPSHHDRSPGPPAEHSRRPSAGDVVTVPGAPFALRPHRHRSPGRRAEHPRWPSPRWPRAVVDAVLDGTAPLGAWQLHTYSASETHLNLFLRASDGYLLKVMIFPRHDDPRTLSAGRFSFAYLRADRAHFTPELTFALGLLLATVSRGLGDWRA